MKKKGTGYFSPQGLRAAVGKVACPLFLLLCACSNGPPYPGNQTLGRFVINAARTSGSGSLDILDGGTDGGSTQCTGAPDGFCFEAILSDQIPLPAGQSVYPAWLTLTARNGSVVTGSTRDGGFDGQFFASTAQSLRAFDVCQCGEGVVVTEVLELAVLSSSQSLALGGVCPLSLLDGGIPTGPNITRPAAQGSTFDAKLVCGSLVDDFIPQPDAGCRCGPASAVFRLSGAPPT